MEIDVTNNLHAHSHEDITALNVLPDHLNQDAFNLTKLLTEYYNFINEVGLPSHELTNLTVHHDLHQAHDQYLDAIGRTIANGIPQASAIDRKRIYEIISDFYKSRGGEKSLFAFFRIFYDIIVEVFYPKEVMFNISTDQSTISDVYKIQDSYYWQIYSYVIRAQESSSEWVTDFRQFMHPAGMKFFYSITAIMVVLNNWEENYSTSQWPTELLVDIGEEIHPELWYAYIDWERILTSETEQSHSPLFQMGVMFSNNPYIPVWQQNGEIQTFFDPTPLNIDPETGEIIYGPPMYQIDPFLYKVVSKYINDEPERAKHYISLLPARTGYVERPATILDEKFRRAIHFFVTRHLLYTNEVNSLEYLWNEYIQIGKMWDDAAIGGFSEHVIADTMVDQGIEWNPSRLNEIYLWTDASDRHTQFSSNTLDKDQSIGEIVDDDLDDGLSILNWTDAEIPGPGANRAAGTAFGATYVDGIGPIPRNVFWRAYPTVGTTYHGPYVSKQTVGYKIKPEYAQYLDAWTNFPPIGGEFGYDPSSNPDYFDPIEKNTLRWHGQSLSTNYTRINTNGAIYYNTYPDGPDYQGSLNRAPREVNGDCTIVFAFERPNDRDFYATCLGDCMFSWPGPMRFTNTPTDGVSTARRHNFGGEEGFIYWGGFGNKVIQGTPGSAGRRKLDIKNDILSPNGRDTIGAFHLHRKFAPVQSRPQYDQYVNYNSDYYGNGFSPQWWGDRGRFYVIIRRHGPDNIYGLPENTTDLFLNGVLIDRMISNGSRFSHMGLGLPTKIKTVGTWNGEGNEYDNAYSQEGWGTHDSDILEFASYDRALYDEEIKLMQSYFWEKWNIGNWIVNGNTDHEISYGTLPSFEGPTGGSLADPIFHYSGYLGVPSYVTLPEPLPHLPHDWYGIKDYDDHSRNTRFEGYSGNPIVDMYAESHIHY